MTLMIGTPKTLLVESIQGAPDGLHRPDNFIRNDVCLLIDRLRIGDSILVDMKERLVADESELPREIDRLLWVGLSIIAALFGRFWGAPLCSAHFIAH